jgi:hypothetical protein
VEGIYRICDLPSFYRLGVSWIYPVTHPYSLPTSPLTLEDSTGVKAGGVFHGCVQSYQFNFVSLLLQPIHHARSIGFELRFTIHPKHVLSALVRAGSQTWTLAIYFKILVSLNKMKNRSLIQTKILVIITKAWRLYHTIST